ncbi:MAG: CDP-diacylglycerol--serine O-phosphatidyltransferase [Planctomycetes bacterium]|nr:CDP-diacylglycerol--serine O-phosphatidyltransferase [Planctomycetota bacterium]
MHEPGRTRFRFWRFRRRRVRTVAILPTLLTLANGVCGFLALLEISKGHFDRAGYLILVAMVFDALDGKVARLTRTATNFGAQMDSLCDLITFGVAPGFLVYAINYDSDPAKMLLPERVLLVVCVFYAMCALLRLARFNVETTPDDASHLSFSGLPSPAAAGTIASAVIPWNAFPDWPLIEAAANLVARGLPFVAFLLGILMVSRIRYAHLVNQLFRGYRPFVRLVELAIVVLLVVIFHEIAIFLAFAGYALTGPLLWARWRLFPKSVPAPVQAADPPQDTSFF